MRRPTLLALLALLAPMAAAHRAGEAGRCMRPIELPPILHAEPVTRVVLESSEGVLAQTRGPG